MMTKEQIYEDLRILGDTYQHMLKERPWMANQTKFYLIVQNRLLENLGVSNSNAHEFLIEADPDGSVMISRNGIDLAVLGFNKQKTDIECIVF